MGFYKFTPNEEVAHIDSLSVKMRVVEIKWRHIIQSTGDLAEDKGFKKEQKRKIDGVVCQWWIKHKLQTQKFHTDLLVPWIIAMKGQEAVDEWKDSMRYTGRDFKKSSPEQDSHSK